MAFVETLMDVSEVSMSPARSTRNSAAALLTVALVVITTIGGCTPTDGEDESRCDDGQVFRQYAGQAACRPSCQTNADCSDLRRTCIDGACLVPDGDAGDIGLLDGGDTTVDSGPEETGTPDVNPCDDGQELTTYNGEEKCRKTCSKPAECPSDKDCRLGHCVAAERGFDTGLRDTGVTRDTGRDTRDTSPPDDTTTNPNGLNCYEILQCRAVCQSTDRNCLAKMEMAGSSTGQNNFQQLVACYNNNCANSTDPNCLENRCSNPSGTGSYDRCYPSMLPARNLTCTQVFQCFSNCPQNDQNCQNNCITKGSRTAQTDVQSYIQCINTECQGAANVQQCVNNARRDQTRCKNQWSTRFNCP